MQTAQNIYQSSIKNLFSTFLAGFSHKTEVKEAAEALLLDFSLWQKTDLAWSRLGFHHFVSQQKTKDQLDEQALRLVTQFVHQTALSQAKIFLHGFLLALKKEGCSSSTIRNYRSDINQFIEFSAETELNQLLTKPKIESFARYQKQKGLKESSIQRKLASITQLANWATVHDLLGQHPLGEEHTHMALSQAQKLTSAIQKKSGSDKAQAVSRLYRPSASRESYLRTLSQKTRRSLLPYLNFGLLVLFILGFSWISYTQFYAQVDQPLAYPSTPTRPNRVLSFQGRLTDTAQNPITVSTNFRFRIFDAVTVGTELWDSGTCAIDPDQDGIFSTTLGDDCGSEISEDVFSENADTWLQVEVGGETLTPRQPISAVPYALNAETLQGYPISSSEAATIDTVVVMNSSGDIVLGEDSPGIRSVSGNFSIEGQSLQLQTTSGSDGDIVLSPDGLGSVIAEKYIYAPGATLSATYAGGTPLTVLGGPSGTANITEWQNSAGSALSVIDENGLLGIGTSNPAAAIEALRTTEQLRLSYDGSNRSTFTVNSSGDLTIAPSGSDLTISGDLIVGSSGTTTFNSVEYTWPGADGSSGYVLSTNGAGTLSWVDNGAGGSSNWTIADGSIYPINETLDLLIGGTATDSATFGILNVTTGTPTASISAGAAGASYLTADGNLATTAQQTLILGGSTTGDIELRPNSETDDYIRITSDGSNPTLASIGTTLLTIDAAGYVRIGDTGTPGSASGDDDLYVEGDLEVDAIAYFDNNIEVVGTTTFNTVAYTWPGSDGSSGYMLTTNGGGTLSWTDPSAAIADDIFWNQSDGALYPKNSTVDVLFGGQATSSATFAFMNIDSGDPTASISGNLALAVPSGADPATTLSIFNGGSFNLQRSAGGDTGVASSLFVNSSGNVGISDDSPAARLDITSSALNTDVFRLQASDGSRLGRFVETSGGYGWFEIDDNGGTATVLFRADGGDNYINAGDFGIGTNAPDNRLDIVTGATTDSEIHLGEALDEGGYLASTIDSRLLLTGGWELVSGTNTARSTVASGIDLTTGTIQFFTDSSLTDGNSFTPTERMRILSNGNVGIGDTNPDTLLDITGTSTQLRLSYEVGDTNFVNFTLASDGDLNINPTGGQVELNDGDTINIGGVTNLGYNAISDSGTTSHSLASDDDLYVEGDFEVDGTGYLDGNIEVVGTTTFNTVAYTWPGSDGSSGYVLSTNGGGTLSWTDPAGAAASAIFWNQTNGALYPKNSTVDLLFGGQSTESAKFAVLNVTDGTPTASVSGGVDGDGAFLTAGGNLATTNNQSLTLGGSTTGNIITQEHILPGTDVSLDLGATSSARFRDIFLGPDSLHIQCTTGDGCGQNIDYQLGVDTSNNVFGININSSTIGDNVALAVTEGANIGLGTVAPAAKLDSLATTEQLRLSYDVSNYTQFIVDSAGDIDVTPTGGDFTISGDLIVDGGTTTFNTVEYTWPGADGSNGYVLSTDGGGNLSWVDAGAGGSSIWDNTDNVYHPIDEFASIVDVVIGGTATASADIQLFANGAAVFNEQGNDADFRVEGTGDANALFVDASTDRVGIRTNTPSSVLEVGGSTSTITNSSGDITIDATSDNISLNGDNLINFAQLQGNDGTVGAPTFSFQNETDTGMYRVTTDTIGFATGGVQRATINADGRLSLVVDGSSAGLAIGAGGDLTAYHDGTDSFIVNSTGDLVINGAAGSEVVFNESGLDIDLRVEGDNDTTLFVVDASADKIGFGTGSPVARYHFTGAATGKALAIFNETGDQNIITASSSGTTRFTVESDGDIIAQRFLDLSNNSFLLDPASTGTSANLAGDITLDSGGTIQSTGNNDIDIDAGSGTVSIGGGTGKFDAGTVDPPYWIDGVGYATYMPSMIGVKEEIAKLVTLQPTSTPGLYKYEINFDSLTKGTDLWLFSRVIDLDAEMKNLVVLLSAQDDAQVAYRKDLAQRKLIIFGNKPTEVSMRLTAPRFDHQKWGVIRENQDGRGFKPGSYKFNNAPDGSNNISDNELASQLAGDTQFTLTSLGQLQIQGAETNQAQLIKDGSVWENLGAFSSAVIANLRAGIVNTGRLAANIKVASPRVETDLISPLSGNDVTVQLGSSQGQTGKLNVRNAQNQTVASVDGNGNAAFAGNVAADKVTANNIESTSSRFQRLEASVAELESVRAETAELVNATVSGTLYTDTIAARVIDGFDDKVASALQQPTLLQQLLDQQSDLPELSSLASLYQITDTDPLTASGAGSLNKSLADLSLDQTDLSIGAEAVFVNQYFEVNGTGYISDSLGVGNSLLIGDGMVLADGIIEYKATAENPSPTLEIQPSGVGSLSLLAGLMTLDETGQVQINGDLAVSGSVTIDDTLLTDLIKPTDFGNPFQVQVAGVATESGELQESRFEIVNELGAPVATISAQGRAEFAGGLGVGSEDLSATNSAEVQAQKTSGRAVIKPSTTQTIIYSSAITENSLIQVTPLGSTNNQVLYVKAQTADNKETPQNEGSFVVGFDSLTFSEVQFSWWIIN